MQYRSAQMDSQICCTSLWTTQVITLQCLDVTPPANPRDRNIDNLIFSNIQMSHLCSVVARIAVLPCSKVIGWIIDNIDVEQSTTINDQGRCIASFLPSKHENYYKFS